MKKESFLKRGKKISVSAIRTILFIELGFVILYPVLYMLTMSFRPVSEMFDPNVIWIPKKFTIDNITTAWKYINFPLSLFNTLKIDVVSALLQTITCCFVGYGFARFKFKENNLLFSIVIFTIIVPPQTILISSYLQFREFDVLYIVKFFNMIFTGNFEGIRLLDSAWAKYLPASMGMGIRAGLFIFIYRQFFKGMPKELEDAASIDGCGPIQTFLKVMLPNASPAVLTTLLFSTVWYWNDTYYAGLFYEKTQTLSLALKYVYDNIGMLIQTGNEVKDPYVTSLYLQAGSLLAVLPLLITYIFLQKYFTESIQRTGIVG